MNSLDAHDAIEWLLSWAEKWERSRAKDASMAATIADFLLELEDRKAAAMERKRA